MKSIEDRYDYEPSEKCECKSCRMRHINRDVTSEERLDTEMKLFEVHKCIDNQVDEAIADLGELVKMKTISVEPEHLKYGCMALEWMANRLAALHFKTHLYPIDNEPHTCFVEPQQKVLFANYFSSPTKTTVMVYAHIDVVPAERDCWFNDPFELNTRDGLIYGRGVTSGKGMVVGWLQAIECWLKINEDLPINIKFIVDMLHEVGSEGLQHYLQVRSDFFLDVDYMIFDTNSWLNSDRPLIACGLTGWAHFGLEVRGANKSLESGLAGGLVFEPMTDICHLMNSLVNSNHEINVPRIDHMVKRLTVEEWHLLQTADFSTYKYMDQLGIRRLRYEGNKVDLLQNRWCKPTLTMHGIEGSDNRKECSQTLPMLIMGKFSIKMVPDQELAHVHDVVKEYLVNMHHELEMGTHLTIKLLDTCEPTSWSTSSKITKVVSRAVGDVFQKEPIASAGISICLPIASVFRKMLNKPIILLPYGLRADRHYQENESIEEDLFMRHSKVCASLLYEISTLPVRCKCGVILEYCQLKGRAERLAALREDEVKETAKRIQLSELAHGKSLHNHRRKKNFRDYLCMPFNYKKIMKKLEPNRTPNPLPKP
ncbi:cytosolic non-specific dipeptidase-like [Drosophila innubila]|uniref:cytosolic non-specific dipeptidase-like n=1 Tax=Drosophila innubila TaxID=198719 RepID=UPI00148C3CFC|nr:cytosolic non-specific dipeptidase-like [Drosophila innubila]